MDRNGTSKLKRGKNKEMKPTVLISSTILAIITVMELSQASQALITPVSVKSTVNQEVSMLFPSDISMRQCRDTNGGRYACPRLVLPLDGAE
jgi:hypothetical protein